MSILFKEMVFEALCNLGCFTFTTLKFENASYKYKRILFGPVNFVKKIHSQMKDCFKVHFFQ